MAYWLIIPTFALCAVLAALLFYLRLRRRRQEFLQLRLLAGQERLLGEEIERRMAILDDLDQEGLQTQRQRAEESLDQLHMDLIERQAHLLNFEDLVHLRQCKLQLLATRGADLEAPPSPPPEAPSSPPESPGQHQDRNQLEDQLRSRISQLKKGRKPGKEP